MEAGNLLYNDIDKKTAFVAIVGKPNVGKSSILNTILSHKIAIVSDKPQTTRTRITGIFTKGSTQLVFIDTPGLHKPRTNLGEYMVRSVSESVCGVDVCMLVVDASSKISNVDIEFIEKFKSQGIKAILVLNKIDLISEKSKLIEKISEYSNLFNFEAIIPVSAIKKQGIDIIVDELDKLAIKSEHFFDSDALTDQPERVIVSEIIREKILRTLDKEIPHGVAVFVERMKQREDNNNLIDIDATIYCEKESHKRILIGKGGAMLKKIGTHARHDIEKFLDCQVNLKLWIKVKENWRNREKLLRDLGYDNRDFS